MTKKEVTSKARKLLRTMKNPSKWKYRVYDYLPGMWDYCLENKFLRIAVDHSPHRYRCSVVGEEAILFEGHGRKKFPNPNSAVRTFIKEETLKHTQRASLIKQMQELIK